MIHDTPARPTPTHPGDPDNGSAARYGEEDLPHPELEMEGCDPKEEGSATPARAHSDDCKPMDPEKPGATDPGASASGDYPPPKDS